MAYYDRPRFRLPEIPYNFPEYKVAIKDDDLIKDRDLLTQIFTPRSSANDYQKSGLLHNEDLKWSGNAILHTIISNMILERYKDDTAGVKTVSLVSISTLGCLVLNKV